MLDVALQVFAERGYHPTSMNDLAEAAGVTKPVLYQHFRSKRALYLELLEDVGGQLRDTIGKATSEAGSPAKAGSRRLSGAYPRSWPSSSRPSSCCSVAARGATKSSPTRSRVEVSIADSIAALIVVDGLDDDRRLLLAHGIVGVAEGTSRHWLANGMTGGADELAEQVAALAWAGLRAVGGQ